jgi:hypothetical protein
MGAKGQPQPDELSDQEEAMPEVGGADAPPPGPTGPMGPGGFEISVYPDESEQVRDFVDAHVRSPTSPTRELITHYVCALQNTGPEGPRNPAAVGRALEGDELDVYGVISRNTWSPKRVRHQVASSTLAREGVEKPDGIVISVVFTDHGPGAMIVTAHAIAERWRMLVGVSRATVEGNGEIDGASRAFADVIQEVTGLQHQIPSPVPILAECPAVGHELIRLLAGGDRDFLIEVTPGWSEGGLMPVPTGRTDRPSAAGTSIRGLFPEKQRGPGLTESRIVRCTAWNRDVDGVALIAGRPARRRAYMGGATNRSEHPQGNAVSIARLEEWASRWSQHDLAGAQDNYGLERFQSTEEHRFDRHFAIVAVRDAYNVFRGVA